MNIISFNIYFKGSLEETDIFILKLESAFLIRDRSWLDNLFDLWNRRLSFVVWQASGLLDCLARIPQWDSWLSHQNHRRVSRLPVLISLETETRYKRFSFNFLQTHLVYKIVFFRSENMRKEISSNAKIFFFGRGTIVTSVALLLVRGRTVVRKRNVFLNWTKQTSTSTFPRCWMFYLSAVIFGQWISRLRKKLINSQTLSSVYTARQAEAEQRLF